MKIARIQSFSGPSFQSEYGKIWTRKTPNTDFLHAAKVNVYNKDTKITTMILF